MAATGDYENAVAVATEAAILDPRKPDALIQLASIFADLSDVDRLEAVANRLVQQFPEQREQPCTIPQLLSSSAGVRRRQPRRLDS